MMLTEVNKSKMYMDAFNDGYQQGKADAIDECKALFRKYILTKEIEALDGLFEQLKEQ